MNPDMKELRAENEDKSIVCNFCNRSKINTLEWGPMYQLNSIHVHYFCLLFSANLSQNGEDNEGILGFLANDIRKELKRGAKLKCTYCKGLKATVGCSVKTCKKSFHYTCGYENFCNFQFTGNFQSFCPTHKPKVDIPEDLLREFDCPICYNSVGKNENLIYPPCCRKAVFHRLCVMKMATHHGYFFKCPLCNDRETFEFAVKMSGVFVPQMDAAWEREPGAFADQIIPYSTCDAEECLCPHGKNHHVKETKWNITRCGGCGSSAIHKECGKLSNFSWKCSTCSVVLAGSGNNMPSQSSQSSGGTDCETPMTSQGSISRTGSARIIRPDFYNDKDYKSCSSSEDDEPVLNVVEILQWNPDLQELEDEVESPAFNLPFNRIQRTGKDGQIFDGLYQKKYRVEGGKNKKDTSSSQSMKSSTSTESCSSKYSGVSLYGQNTNAAERNSAESISKKIREHFDRFKKCSQQIRDSNVALNQNGDCNAQTQTNNKFYEQGSNTQAELGLLEMLTAPQISRRKLNFESKHSKLPTIQLANSNPLTLGPEIDLTPNLSSAASTKTNETTVFNTITVEPDYEIPDTPETNRNTSWSPLSYQNPNSALRSNCVSDSDVSFLTNENQNKSPVKNEHETRVAKTISSPNGKIHVISLDNKPRKPVEVVDLDDDNEDDIIVDGYDESNPPIKILSVTSLSNSQPIDFVPKSAAFMSMMSKFNNRPNFNFASRPKPPPPPQSNIINKPADTKEIIEIILDDSDEETSTTQRASQKHQMDKNGVENSRDSCQESSAPGKCTRQWQSDDGNSKRPRLSTE